MDNNPDQASPGTLPPAPASPPQPAIDPFAAQDSASAVAPIVQSPPQATQGAITPPTSSVPNAQPLAAQMPGTSVPTVQPVRPGSSPKKWIIIGGITVGILLIGAGLMVYLMTKSQPQPAKSAAQSSQPTPVVKTVAKMSDSSSVGPDISFLFTPPAGWTRDPDQTKERYNGPNGASYTVASIEKSATTSCKTHASCTDYMASFTLSYVKKDRGWENAEIKKEEVIALSTDTKDFQIEVVHVQVTYTKKGVAGSADFFGRHMGTRGIYALFDSPNNANVSHPETGLSIIKKVSKK